MEKLLLAANLVVCAFGALLLSNATLPQDGQDKDTLLRRLEKLESEVLPVGSIIQSGVQIEDPKFILCDGREIDIAKYPEFVNLAKQSSGLFRNGKCFSPDLTNRAARGVKNASQVGLVGGSDSFTLSIDNLPPHKPILRMDMSRDSGAHTGKDGKAFAFQMSRRWGNKSWGNAKTGADENAVEAIGKGTEVNFIPSHCNLLFYIKVAEIR